MNAAGMTFVLTGVSAVLEMPDYRSLVTDGSIRQDEFDATRRDLSAIIATLKNTPSEKIEKMVAQYDQELTTYLDKFNAAKHLDHLGSFKSAQIMIGYVTSIMGKSGLRK